MTYIPPSVRRRIGLPAHLYPVTGFRIRFGTDPGEPAGPGDYEYEFTEADRNKFESAVADLQGTTTSQRIEQINLAFQGWMDDHASVFGPLGQAGYLGYKAANFLLMSVFGKLFRLHINAGDAATTYQELPPDIKYGQSQGNGGRMGIVSAITPVRWHAENGEWSGTVGLVNRAVNWRKIERAGAEPEETEWYNAGGQAAITAGGHPDTSPRLMGAAASDAIPFPGVYVQAEEPDGALPAVIETSSGTYSGEPTFALWAREIELSAGGAPVRNVWIKVRDLPANLDFEGGMPGFEGADFGGGELPENPDYRIPKEDFQELLDRLPDPVTPPDPVNPDPIPRPPGGPWDPEWPCNPSGPFPPGGPDPDPPGEPPYVPPGPPGGPPIGPPVIPVPGPPVIPFPECPEDVFPGEEATLDAGGKTFKGRVRARRPSADPGMECEIEIEPPPYDDTFQEARCYDNALAVDIMRELAVELGMDPELLIVDPTCDVRFTGCFKKGSSKLDALWGMADLCGYGIIPDPTDPVIGRITPVPIFHGPYHEDGSLGDGSAVYEPYERTYDNIEMVHSVEYYRPNLPGLPGFSVVALVDTGPFSVPEDRVERHLAPRSMTASQAQDAADAKARDLAARGATATFVVRLDVGIAQRHQCEIRRPSRGYSIQYMVLSLRHEFDDADGGHVTVVEGRELGVTRYTPAPGTQGLPAPKFDEDGRID